MTPKSGRKGHRKIPGRETYSRLWFNLKQIPLFSYSRTNRLRRGDREVYSSARSPGLENSFLNGGGQIKIFFENFKMAVVWRERRFVKTHRVFSRVFSGLWLFSSGIRGYSAQNAPVFPEPLSRQIAVWNFVTHVYCPLPSFKSAFSLQNTSSPGSPHSSFSSSLPSLWFTSPTLRVVREFENKGICLGWVSSFYLRGLLRAIFLLHTVRQHSLVARFRSSFWTDVVYGFISSAIQVFLSIQFAYTSPVFSHQVPHDASPVFV